ncbi:MAG: hypothetical protein JO023_29275 [Chloroflexi bacterium]|nr:hypothetical protein [Chloroflexota bacterium]
MQQRDASHGLRVAQAVVVVAALVTGRRHRRGPTGVDQADLRAGYQLKDMQVGVVASVLVALVAVLAVLLVLVTVFMARVTGIPPSISRPNDLIQGTASSAQPTPPAPRLQPEPGTDRAAYQAQEQAQLQSYRWVDRDAGVVSIPIDRAMDLTLQRGLPARATPAPSPGEAPGQSPSTSSSGRVEQAWP